MLLTTHKPLWQNSSWLRDVYAHMGGHFVVVVQLLSRQSVWFFAIPCAVALQAALSFTISRSLLKLMSIESLMLSNHLALCRPLLLLPSIFLSFRGFSNGSVLHIRWPKYWNFSIGSSNEYSGLISLWLTGWISLQSKGLLRVFSSTTVWKHQCFGTQPSLWSNSHIHTWLLKNHSFDHMDLLSAK